ncbi:MULTISPECIES: hypothetical protein [Hydrocarboniphaga]|jgi:hypothetical protein|uniref:Secreted protein n=1 Tax=Hydrocarboniphaga effusa AP103 TaxID=1172194 RepID=I8HWJ0_9GAMM|nr:MULTISPECIES: hypothetical protein [Hydrocarboniphaga]EIT67706.1 hypothetical protein WQQ_41410 [Hydrocarboniphaga effusa AP103]MDZ4079753.1 hypothetical protein [Hydrocarboniphaga sp.]
MKKSFVAAILLSLSAPLAMAHGNHEPEEEGAVVKPQSVRKAGASKAAPKGDKAQGAETEAEKADEKAPAAPTSK